MQKSICGADCENCGYGKAGGCKGCAESKGCPFGKKCFIYSYIQTGGIESYNQFKQTLIDEINALHIPGMPKIDELSALNGAFVNLAYPMPSGEKVKLLDDSAVYLGTQACCEFDDGSGERCFGVVAGADFIAVSEYGENGSNPELVMFVRR